METFTLLCWNTFNYQRNTFDWLITQSHKGAKSKILIIALLCKWQVFQNLITNSSRSFIKICKAWLKHEGNKHAKQLKLLNASHARVCKNKELAEKMAGF